MNPAAPPNLGGLEGLLEDFDDDAVDLDTHGDARAGEEKKEAVQLEQTTLRGLLLKKLAPAVLESPAVAVDMGLKKIGKGVDDGLLPDHWRNASVMRVGNNNALTGLIMKALPEQLTDPEKDFIGADDGFILVFLRIDADSVKTTVTFDGIESPIKSPI